MAVYQIPVTKGKATVAIDSEAIPEAVYAEALKLGLKELVNRGMTKITKSDYPTEEAFRAAAMEQAAKNVEAINSGKIRFAGGAAAKKASGAVMTEARRLAKQVIKDEMKRKGIKLAHVDSSEITRLANVLLASDQGQYFLREAEAELKRREEVKAAVETGGETSLSDILSGIAINPTKKAKAEARKASPAAAGQLSAKQASKVAPRTKPQAHA
jgi:hypothetical protein